MLAASGTVGLVAVQAAKLLGAGRVVAAGRRPEGLRRAAELGADATVSLADARRLAEALREACRRRRQVVIDPLWGEPGGRRLRRAGPLRPPRRARPVGRRCEATFTSAAVRNHAAPIIGHTNYAVPVEDQRGAYERMAAHAAAGELTADYEAVGLDDAPAAWERLREGPGRSWWSCRRPGRGLCCQQAPVASAGGARRRNGMRLYGGKGVAGGPAWACTTSGISSSGTPIPTLCTLCGATSGSRVGAEHRPRHARNPSPALPSAMPLRR